MILAVDTETTGTDFIHGCRPFMVLACDGKHNYVWQGVVYDNRTVEWAQQALDEIQELLDYATTIVFHNAPFDLEALESIGIKIDHLFEKVEDTMIASHAVKSDGLKGLKYLGVKYLQYSDADEKELERAVLAERKETTAQIAKGRHPHFPGKNGSWKQDMWLAPKECEYYGKGDVERTFIFWKMFRSKMFEWGILDAYKLRKQLIPVVMEIKRNGLNFYVNMAKEEIEVIEARQADLVHDIKSELQINRALDLNVKSDLMYMFLTCLKLEEFTTEKGNVQMDKQVIEHYLLVHDHLDVIRYYQEWKRLEKKRQQLKNYVEWSHHGRIHGTLLISGTRETRQASRDPNTQNIDRELKKTFFGPPEGYIWAEIDCVNIELCIWAYAVGNQELISRFEAGESIHAMITKALYPYTEEWDAAKIKASDEYARCKAGNFSRIYGAGKAKANRTYGVADATTIIDKKFPEINKFFEYLNRKVKQNYKEYGDYCVFTLLDYKLNIPADEAYKAANYYIQGSAGIIMSLMMVATYNLEGPFKTINQVHDSLVFELKEEDEYFVPTLELTMVNAVKHLLPACAVDTTITHCKEIPF